jgi:HSP20 family protein
VLLIWGERDPRPDQLGDVSYYVRERQFGAFRRSITLPERVTKDRLRASLENGLLEVIVAGGAADDVYERIEIAGGDPTRVQVDVAPREGER